MSQKNGFSRSGGQVVQCLLPALVVAAMISPANAADWAAIQKGLESLKPLAQQMDRDSENRRRQQEADQARLEAERQRKQQAEARAKAAEEQKGRQEVAARAAAAERENAMLSPPPEWAGLPVLNRRVLERKGTGGQGADFEVTAKTKIAFSSEGDYAAYVDGKGDLILRQLASGSERVVRQNIPLGEYSYFYFIGNKYIQYNDGKNTSIFDFDGTGAQFGGLTNVVASEGRVIAVEYESKPMSCKAVAEYDLTGTLVSRVDMAGKGYNLCHPSYEKAAQLDFIALNESTGEVAHFVGSQKVSTFTATTPGKISQVARVDENFVAAFSYRDYNPQPTGLWDMRSGTKVCDLPKGAVVWGKKGRFFTHEPAAALDPNTCQLTTLASGKIASIDEDYLTVFDQNTGDITLYDVKTLQQVRRIATQKSGKTMARRPKGGNVVFVGPEYFNNEGGGTTQVYDIKTGALLQEVPGWLSYSANYTTDDAKAKNGTLHTAKVWKLQTGQIANSDFTKFVETLKKDKYETTTEYRNRVAKVSYPYQIDVDVKDYNADGSFIEAQYQGVPIGVPMAPAQARRLDGQTKLTLQGQLRVVDDEFVIMRNASVKASDGTTISVPDSKVPARRPGSAATSAAAKGADASVVMQSAGAGTPSGGMLKTGGKAGGACSGNFGYMASQLPAYTDPGLATVRSQLLAQSVSSLAAELKAQGRTISALDEPIAEGE